MNIEDIEFNVFYPWSGRSSKTPFVGKKGIGDGEDKVASELSMTIQGQNSSHDLHKNGKKYEVKKLDRMNSVRNGVEIKRKYNDIKLKILNFIEKIGNIVNKIPVCYQKIIFQEWLDKIYNSSSSTSKICVKYTLEELNSKTVPQLKEICKEKGLRLSENKQRKRKDELINQLLDPTINDYKTETCSIYEGICKDEICESSLNKLNELFIELNQNLYNLQHNGSKNTVELFSCIDGARKQYNLSDAYKKLEIDRIPFEVIVEIMGGIDNYVIGLCLSELNTIIIETSIKELLTHAIKDYYREIQLIIVDEEKGFKFVDVDNIICKRITSGGPRLNVL